MVGIRYEMWRATWIMGKTPDYLERLDYYTSI